MQPIYLSIQQEETGAQIRKLMMKNGYEIGQKMAHALWKQAAE